MIAALLLTVALVPAGYCVEDGQTGFATVDGCVTQAEYDVLYADPFAELDALEYQFGLEVERDTPAPGPASERPREFEGESLPSVAELIARAEDAADNPALAGIW